MIKIENKGDTCGLGIGNNNVSVKSIHTKQDLIVEPKKSIIVNTGVKIECSNEYDEVYVLDSSKVDGVFVNYEKINNESLTVDSLVLEIYNFTDETITIGKNTTIAYIYSNFKNTTDEDFEDYAYNNAFKNDDIIIKQKNNSSTPIKNVDTVIHPNGKKTLVINFED